MRSGDRKRNADPDGGRRGLQALEPRLLFTAVPYITEFMASNDTVFADEDGDFSDWIELHNAGDSALNLDGWYLTDDASDRDKWAFPAVSIAPGAYLLVFASLKDRADADGTELHTNFRLGAGGEYLALVEPDGSTVAHEYAPEFPSQEPDVSYGLAMVASGQTLVDETTAMRYLVPINGALGTSWTQIGFNDNTWNGGTGTTAGVGYENNPGAATSFVPFLDTTVPSGTTSVYTRFDFNVTDPAEISSLTLDVMYDDGFVAYLNGVPVADDFAPVSPQWNSVATDGRGDGDVIEDFVAFDITDHVGDLLVGHNVLAVHALNEAGSSDMLMTPRLVAGNASLIEPIEEGFFATPTPGSANGSTFLGFVADTAFSVDRGFYTSEFDVEISSATAGATIYYTTDGSAPSVTNGSVYSAPVNISTTTVLRAVATLPGFVSSNIDTQSYLFLDDVLLQDGAGLPAPPNPSVSTWDYEVDPDIVNDPRYADSLVSDLMTIPTLSLVMDVEDVWGATGFYANPRNSGIAWERPVSVELIDTDGTGLFQQDGGIRIMGSGSTTRALGKKSMRIVFREAYGEAKLLYPFFGEDRADEIDTIAIRGNYFDTWTFQSDSGSLGGSCCGRSRSSYLRDQFAHETHEAMGGHAIAGNWVHLYINGIYWGVYNPTERPDEEFLQSYFGGSDADYDVIKTNVELVNGDLNGWNEMMAIVRGNGGNGSLANSAAYADLQQYLDVEQFADYLLLNFWGGNHDWPHNNWYAVRDRVNGGQFTFYSWDAENFLFNVNSDRTGVSNANTAGEIYDRLRLNAEFRQLFADRVQLHMFNGGALTPASTAARFQSIVDTIRPALNAEAARWGDELVPNNPYNVIDHYDPLTNEKLTNYFPQRTGIVLSQLRAAGLYPGTSQEAPFFSQHGGPVPIGFALGITNVEPSGTVYYTLDGSDPRLPGGGVSPTAIAYTGALELTESTTIRMRLIRFGSWSALVEADFLVGAVADTGNLRITEVHYNPASPTAAEQAAGYLNNNEFEFIELLNTSAQPIELQLVKLAGAIDFTFNSPTTLAPFERVVLVENQAAFEFRYDTGIRVVGQWSGRLNNTGDSITLSDHAGQVIQSFAYDDEIPWPTAPDGGGQSLVVIDTEGDYNDGSNWRASNAVGGSPGEDEPALLPGDFNVDGSVTAADYTIWADTFGSALDLRADGNGDGVVTAADYTIWADNFGASLAAAVSGGSGLAANSQAQHSSSAVAGDPPWPDRGQDTRPGPRASGATQDRDRKEVPEPAESVEKQHWGGHWVAAASRTPATRIDALALARPAGLQKEQPERVTSRETRRFDAMRLTGRWAADTHIYHVVLQKRNSM